MTNSPVPSSTPASVGDGATPLPSSTAMTASAKTSIAAQDEIAGVKSREVPSRGDGELNTVPGAVAAPDPSKQVVNIAVQVEGGQSVDSSAFAKFVLDTLNDKRSWARDGRSFAKVAKVSQADVTVVLASPETSAALCRPLVTGGRLSCRNGRRAVLTNYRWVNGQDDFGDDLTMYRRYVVNHEVGHFLGHGHHYCPGKGKRAPLMMQQTKGLKGCLPNAWPYP